MSSRLQSDFIASADERVTTFVGVVSPVRLVRVNEHARAVSAESMQGIIDLRTAHTPPRLEDVCPDPLVFAIESGLPRIRVLDRQIDGGSSWRNLRPVPIDDSFYAVSQISAVDERHTATGRLMMRAHYETRFTTRRGELIGTAIGYSLDVEVAS